MPRIESMATPALDARLEISPTSAFVDEEVRIGLDGLPPHQAVVLRAKTHDDENRSWSSQAEFRADAFGRVDIATQESSGGSYCGVAAMGLFWSMQLAGEHADGHTIFAKTDPSPNIVAVDAEVDGHVVASAQLERMFLAAGTRIRDLRIGDDSQVETAPGQGPGLLQGHVARLFLPPPSSQRDKYPAVVVLGGSGGGFDVEKAAVLSRHGFAALALAYFGIPPLPEWLHRIPLDYVEAALAWLAAQPEIDSQRIGLLGVSRGAELALLLGTRLPQVHAVVAYSPSSVAWSAGGRDRDTNNVIPAWTWRDEAIPFAPLLVRQFLARSAFPSVVLRRPVIFRHLFEMGLRNRQAVERASIPVERISGPILLISGGDDHVWPAAEMSETIVARLKQHGFVDPVEHLHYPRAGHMLRYPYLPTTPRQTRHRHLWHTAYSFGGTAPADAEAQADSWRRAIAFLQNHL
jgi:dienelactone hydrolase